MHLVARLTIRAGKQLARGVQEFLIFRVADHERGYADNFVPAVVVGQELGSLESGEDFKRRPMWSLFHDRSRLRGRCLFTHGSHELSGLVRVGLGQLAVPRGRSKKGLPGSIGMRLHLPERG